MPKVFISSTSEDLKPHRAAVHDAAKRQGFDPIMMEYLPGQGALPPYPACMAKVAECDLVIAIAAHRYGWIPPDQPDPPAAKSITWLECEHAATLNPKREVLVFVIHEDALWPPKMIDRDPSRLDAFKQWVSSLGFRSTFTNPQDLATAVAHALSDWKDRRSIANPATPANPAKYLEQLRDQTAWIDIRGLNVASGRANRFPIADLYIPLVTAGAQEDAHKQAPREERKAPQLEEALRHRRLVIVGDPGSGKTTFLRRIAFELCRRVHGEPPSQDMPLPAGGFPILVRIAELERHIENNAGRNGAPSDMESPAWLAHFLAAKSSELAWNLDIDFFAKRLSSKDTVLLLDGLDEAPRRSRREEMARLFEHATTTYTDCRFVVTTRPGSYTASATLAGFQEVRVAGLEDDAIEVFLKHWSAALFPADQAGASQYEQALQRALAARPEIRSMTRNPVMLTALAVMQWNEKRLPEQRADLYESILTWLARQREKRAGREPPERCLAILSKLALGMQTDARGRLKQIDKGPAADLIAPEFRGVPESERFNQAQCFLDEEEIDSGIIVSRGATIEFWHLTFQEYLAAREIAGLTEVPQANLLFANQRLYQPEWREVLLLLAGTLHVKQGRSKVDWLFNQVLDRLGDKPTLLQNVQCAGLLGAMLADLQPLKYQVPGQRYREVLDGVLPIFERHAAKGHAAKGHAAKGHAAKGHAAKGHAAKGHAAKGHAAKGHAAKGIDIRLRVDAAEALGRAGDPRLKRDNWVTLPPVTFTMGAQKKDSNGLNYDMDAYDNETVREVSLEAFQMGRYPVTVAEYERFWRDGGYAEKKFWKAGGFGGYTEPRFWADQLLHPNRPVVNVTWFEAAAYCAWVGGRLPSEEEWERAARGSEGRKYPWGNEAPSIERANYRETGVGAASPVGLFPLGGTQQGIQDMAGNVWEWTASWYREDQSRCVRGGSWYLQSTSLRAAYRGSDQPVSRDYNVGFRCVREIP